MKFIHCACLVSNTVFYKEKSIITKSIKVSLTSFKAQKLKVFLSHQILKIIKTRQKSLLHRSVVYFYDKG